MRNEERRARRRYKRGPTIASDLHVFGPTLGEYFPNETVEILAAQNIRFNSSINSNRRDTSTRTVRAFRPFYFYNIYACASCEVPPWLLRKPMRRLSLARRNNEKLNLAQRRRRAKNLICGAEN